MLLVASSRGSVKIDQDLSLKHVGPLALARLYGKFCITICYRKAVEEDFLGLLGNRKAVEENRILSEENRILQEGNLKIREEFHDISEQLSSDPS